MNKGKRRLAHTLLVLSLLSGSMGMMIAPGASALTPVNEISMSPVDVKDAEGKYKQDAGKRTYVVKLKKNVTPNQFKGKKGLHDRAIKRTLKSNSITMELTEEEYQALAKDGEVMYVEPDYSVSITELVNDNNDSNVVSASVSDATYGPREITPWGIRAIGADLLEQPNQQGQGVKIAVLDTGIASHPDLNIAGGVSFVDGVHSYEDDNGHGTHIAGIIGAQENGIGVVGAAPYAELYAVKVLDHQGKGTYSQVIQGIEWAVEQQVDIISLSLGGNNYSQALHEAVRAARSQGVLIVASAGNLRSGEETMTYPARYSEAISVGAVNENYERASFSSTGAELDIMAPGTNILSTDLSSSYREAFGTSASAAYVSGAAATVWSAHPEWTSEQVEQQLKSTAFTLGDPVSYGSGIVNAARAHGLSVDAPEIPLHPVPETTGLESLKKTMDSLHYQLSEIVKLVDKQDDEELKHSVNKHYANLKSRKVSIYSDLLKLQEGLDATIGNRYAFILDELIEDYQLCINQYSYLVGYEVTSQNYYWEEWYYYGEIYENTMTDFYYSYGSDAYEYVVIDFYPQHSGTYQTFGYPYYYQYDNDNDEMYLDVYEVLSSGQLSPITGGSSPNLDTGNFEMTAGKHYKFYLYSAYPEDEVETALIIYRVVPGQPILAANPVDVSSDGYAFYRFTPSISGTYDIFTGPHGSNGYMYSNQLEVFGTVDHYNLIAYDDNHVTPYLNAGTTYYIRIGNSHGWLNARFSINPTLQTDTVSPSIPTSLVVSSHTANSALLHWNPSTDNYGVVSYDIYNGASYIGTSTTTSFTATNLSTNTPHSFTVKAKDIVGRVSDSSNAANLYIDTLAPSAPSNLVITNQSTNSVSFSWSPSSDNIGAAQYLIFNGAVQIGTSATTNFTISPLVANTNYSISVKAKDAAGNVSASSAVVQHSTGAGSFTYVYDRAGRIDYIQYSNGKKLDYTFDANGNLKSITVINP